MQCQVLDVVPSSALDPSVYRMIVPGSRDLVHFLCWCPSFSLVSPLISGGVRKGYGLSAGFSSLAYGVMSWMRFAIRLIPNVVLSGCGVLRALRRLCLIVF